MSVSKRSPSAVELTSSLFVRSDPAPDAAAVPQPDGVPPADPASPAPVQVTDLAVAPKAVSEPPVPTKGFDASSVTSRYTSTVLPEPPPGQTEPPAAEVPLTDPKAAHAWAGLRTRVKEAETKVSQFQKDAETAQEEARQRATDQAKLAAELEEAKKREQALVEKLGRLSLSESPEFQRKYDLRLAEVKTKLGKALVKFTGAEDNEAAQTVMRILSADPKDLTEMLSGFNPSVAGLILNITSEAAAIDEAKRLELDNWRQTGAAAASIDARKTVVEQAANRRKLSEAAVEAAKAYGNPVFTSDDPSVKEAAEALVNEFHGFVQSATEDQLIMAAAEGYSAPYLYEALNRQQQEIAELREQLSGRTRASMPPLFPSAGMPLPPAAAPAPGNVTAATPPDSPREYALGAAAEALRQLTRTQ